MTLLDIERLEADRALWGLDDEQERQLTTALRAIGRHTDTSWERAAATLTAALLSRDECAPPETLIQRLRTEAPLPRPSRRWPRATNPLLAAALLLLSASLWIDSGTHSVKQDRAALLGSRTASLWQFERGTTRGDVVWDAARQDGFLRFRNLPTNDPGTRQYQLWILDEQRDKRYPVDGGVFDIPPGHDEVVVRIDPKLLVHEAAAFVVTVEQPGGVVVSARSNIAALAKRQ